jgi:hypothetical protein
VKHKKPPWIEDPSMLDMPSEQVLRPVDPGYENVDRLAEDIAAKLGYAGAAFSLKVIDVETVVFDRARLGEVCLYLEDKLSPFVFGGIEDVHGGLRLGPDDAAKVRAWFRSKSAELPAPQQAETQFQAAALASKSASDDVEPDKAGPLPLATGDIAFSFSGLHGWSEKQWKKPLGDKPKWLQPCIAIRGVRGVSETRWNPVLIGAALVHKGHAKANSIRARFQTMPQLAPWLDAWKTYEADNIPTE